MKSLWILCTPFTSLSGLRVARESVGLISVAHQAFAAIALRDKVFRRCLRHEE
ncbi:hypothetical protein O5585_28350, partial [Escherichia coli]|nr:hypothetical protein [Escherichia coli]